jgi:hypothetical protein
MSYEALMAKIPPGRHPHTGLTTDRLPDGSGDFRIKVIRGVFKIARDISLLTFRIETPHPSIPLGILDRFSDPTKNLLLAESIMEKLLNLQTSRIESSGPLGNHTNF